MDNNPLGVTINDGPSASEIVADQELGEDGIAKSQTPKAAMQKKDEMKERMKKAKTYYVGGGQERIAGFNEKAHEIMTRNIGKLKDRYLGLVEKLHKLQNKKYEIQKQPRTKDDLLKEAKEQLRRKKKEILVDKMLLPHFQGCQQRQAGGLTEAELRVRIFEHDEFWRLLYLIITEKDIEDVIGLLPDGVGLSESDKKAECEKIDREILKIGEVIEKEFKA